MPARSIPFYVNRNCRDRQRGGRKSRRRIGHRRATDGRAGPIYRSGPTSYRPEGCVWLISRGLPVAVVLSTGEASETKGYEPLSTGPAHRPRYCWPPRATTATPTVMICTSASSNPASPSGGTEKSAHPSTAMPCAARARLSRHPTRPPPATSASPSSPQHASGSGTLSRRHAAPQLHEIDRFTGHDDERPALIAKRTSSEMLPACIFVISLAR
jgi:hypothetical protein